MKSSGGTCKCRQNVQLLRVEKKSLYYNENKACSKSNLFFWASWWPGGLRRWPCNCNIYVQPGHYAPYFFPQFLIKKAKIPQKSSLKSLFSFLLLLLNFGT